MLRCVPLAHVAQSGVEDPASWAELLNKMKESIVITFDTNVSVYEEDVRKLDSQRSMPGWNFCTFFIYKVCCIACAGGYSLT